MKCPACHHELPSHATGYCPECGLTIVEQDSRGSGLDSSATSDATFVSDEWPVDAPSPAEQTIGLEPLPISSEDIGTAEIEAVPNRYATEATIPDLESHLNQLAEQPADRTIVADESHDFVDRTIVGESMVDASIDSSPATVALQPASGDELRTLQSKWSGTDDGVPERTIKSRADESTDGSGVFGDTLSAVPHRSLRTLDGPPGSPQLAEYELLKVLGEGGMGVVWSARQTSVDRHVAVKMIKGPQADKRSQRQKFLAEAVVTGDLDHPNIVPIYDVGTDAVGTLFYSMKQVKGTPWLKVIKEKSLQENLEILLRVADAVSFAHSRNIIHRDLKPENVMLGEYGEVLVMDWGLALATGELEKARQLRQSTSMGGTPAYMAPEMATGPLDRIGPHSDLYLLGAILWEVLTGKPPHPGKKVQESLLAAIRNVIIPTEKTGELVDIARKAMSTNPADRYPTVRAFQQAIRDSFSHSESVAMAARAQKELDVARETDKYTDYAKAVFGFEEAYDLWNGNREAQEGIDAAKLAYAGSAFSKGDYDLGATLLRPDHLPHRDLLMQIQEAARERSARKHRLKFAKRAMTTLGIVLFLVITTAFFWIRREHNYALDQQRIALEQKQIAVEERDRAEIAKQHALEAQALAVAAREQETTARKQEATARQEEAAARQQEAAARKAADEARVAAEDAKLIAERAKLDEEYEAYIARIGLAAAKIDENAFEVAVELLNDCPPGLRNWEWGRLMHLCRQASQVHETEGPVDTVAISPDGTKFAAASWDKRTRVWDLQSGKQLLELPQSALYVHAVAWSPNQNIIVTGGNDPQGLIRFWDSKSGRELAHINGHTDAVVSVHFSPDGKQLVSTSYDQTARLWDVSDVTQPKPLHTFDGHNWWVWDAAFSPDFNLTSSGKQNRLVTVGQDGKAIVWEIGQQQGQILVQESTVFTGHVGPVYTVAFDPNGQSIATGGYDKRILIWKPEEIPPFNLEHLLSGERPDLKYREFLGHTAPVESIAFSSEGATLVSGSRDNAVKAWSVATGKSVKTFRGHFSGVRSVAMTPDGRRIVSGGQDHRAIVWTIDDYEEIRVLNGRQLAGHEDAILHAAFSLDGEKILTASRDRTARTWDVKTGRVLKTFAEGHDYLASHGIFFPDGRTLVTSAADNTVRLWNVVTGTQFLTLPQTGRTAALALSADAKWLMTGSDDDAGKLWKVSDLFEFASDPDPARSSTSQPSFRPLTQHNGRITAAAFSPVANLLVTCDANGRCQLHDVDQNRSLWNMRHHTRRVTAVAFTVDGKQILTASSDHTVSRIDTATGEELAPLILKHSGPVVALDLNADGTRVLTVEAYAESRPVRGARIRLWETATARELDAFNVEGFDVNTVGFVPHTDSAATVCSDNTVRLFRLQPGAETDRGGATPWLNFQKLGGIVWSVTFAKDGHSALTVGGSEARLWDVPTRQEKMSFSPHGAVAAASFSPDGNQIITGSWDNSAKIWNAQTAQAVRRLENGHQGYINSVVYSPDGKLVLTASDDGTAKLWDVQGGEILKVFSGHQGRVRQAIFSPDGKQILTVGSDRTARLWHAATAQPIGQPFTGHRWGLLCGAFSPDGQRILTGGEDNDARLWDLKSGMVIAVYQGHTAAVTSVTFSADGLRAFTASQDNSAKLWDATPGREGTEILTLTGHGQELTSIAVSPNGRQVLTASRDGTAVLWLANDWSKPVSAEAVPQRRAK